MPESPLIRVGYDVSYQAKQRYKREQITGVGRVIEEVQTRLAASPEVNLSLLGLYGGDDFPLETDLGAREYWSAHAIHSVSHFLPAAKSRWGLTRALSPALMGFERRDLKSSSKEVKEWSVPARVIRKLLRKATSADSIPNPALQKLDIFHATFNPLPPPSVTGASSRLITMYDIIPLRHPSGIDPGFWQRIVDSVGPQDWVVAISEFSKVDFCEYANFPLERCFVAPLAVGNSMGPIDDPAKVETCRQKYKLPNGPYLLSVSNPQPRKNIPHLIHSFYELIQAQPDLDVNLVLAGSHSLGWGTSAIFEAIESVPALKERVHITGYVDEEDLSALYSGALAFVFPSLQEGFGLPILEAMQCGVPVISSNTTSLPEVAGEAAILVDPDDSAALSAAMLSVVESSELRAKMSAASLERATHFSWDNTTRDVLNAYRIIYAAR